MLCRVPIELPQHTYLHVSSHPSNDMTRTPPKIHVKRMDLTAYTYLYKESLVISFVRGYISHFILLSRLLQALAGKLNYPINTRIY